MPDSLLPPSWGPAPFDERDLDAVLSGATVDIPVALRPAADILAALRAAAAPAEFSGQATIMAEFRVQAEFRALGLAEAARAADPAMTLQLPVLPADRPRRRTAPHRGRRRAASRVSLRAGALMGAAAAAAIVITVVLAGNLPGPIQHLAAHFAHLSTVSPSSRPAAGSGASPGLQVTGAATEPAHPKPSHHATVSPATSPSSRRLRRHRRHPSRAGSAARFTRTSNTKRRPTGKRSSPCCRGSAS
jgi:hypothetical protein